MALKLLQAFNVISRVLEMLILTIFVHVLIAFTEEWIFLLHYSRSVLLDHVILKKHLSPS